MKKMLFLLLVLPLIFSSCSKDNNIPTAVLGCSDSTATNYNALATVDDGSCTYSVGATGYFHKDGSFYKTTDSGVNWALQAHCGLIDPDIKGISFVNASIGFFQEEGNFWITTTSGDIWTNQGNSHGLSDVDQISFIDELTGYFQANGDFYKTINSGVTWINKGNSHGINDPDIKGISFISDDTGYFQSDGFFYKTTDSGLTWSQQGNGLADDIEGISFVN